jgi:hypothetical protein
MLGEFPRTLVVLCLCFIQLCGMSHWHGGMKELLAYGVFGGYVVQ